MFSSHRRARFGIPRRSAKRQASPPETQSLDTQKTLPSPTSPDQILKLQRTIGNKAVQRLLTHSPAQVVQRDIDQKALAHTKKEIPEFAAIYDTVIQQIAQSNDYLWKYITDPNYNVVLEFTPDTGLFAGGEGETKIWIDQKGTRTRIENFDYKSTKVEATDPIIIQILIGKPRFFGSDGANAGEIAQIMLHEYAIHAERFAKSIMTIRKFTASGLEGSKDQLAMTMMHYYKQGDWDAVLHHKAIWNPNHPNFQMYQDLIKNIGTELAQSNSATADGFKVAVEKEASNYRQTDTIRTTLQHLNINVQGTEYKIGDKIADEFDID